MTIEQAIEILTINNEHNPNYTDTDRQKAHQLGIEALEKVKGGLQGGKLEKNTQDPDFQSQWLALRNDIDLFHRQRVRYLPPEAILALMEKIENIAILNARIKNLLNT